MFDSVFENLRKASELTIQTQRDLFKKWFSFWEEGPAFQPVWGEKAQKIQKQWGESVAETLKRQREALESQFNAGLKSLEAAFAVAGAKNPEEVRARTVELWEKTFDCLRVAFEAQATEFQKGISKWSELAATNK
jgi:hypothetical protein